MNKRQHFSKNIFRALNYTKIEQITKNARDLIEKEFIYEKAVERYRGVLSSLNIGQRKTDSIPEE